MSDSDLIIGVHSIAEAIKNSDRNIYSIVGSDEGFKELFKRGGVDPKSIENVNQTKVSPHQVQELAKKEFSNREMTFHRVPSQIYATTSPLNLVEVNSLMEEVKSGKPLKILALDQVTDTHNAAAILRTAAFYGVDYLVFASKGNFGFSPSYYRIASGATEFVKIVKANSLPKLLNKLSSLNVDVIGLSEHASDNELSTEGKATCLVLGAEDVGISNAVSRAVTKTIALQSKGGIKSLNVSVAAAVAMEKIF